MRKIVIFLLVLPCILIGQNSNWTKEYTSPRAIIENKGQFNYWGLEDMSNVDYVLSTSSELIYFTPKGVVFELNKIERPIKSEEEKAWRKQRKTQPFNSLKEWQEFEDKGLRLTMQKDKLSCLWIGANTNPQIIPLEQSSYYHNYTYYDENYEQKTVEKVKSFNKLIYKNVYPNIDVIYEVHPKSGIKYSIVVNPGGDVSEIKLNYSKNPLLMPDGSMSTGMMLGGAIIDHPPYTFYADSKSQIITSSYKLNENIIGFNVSNYDQTRTIIIDPWTQSPSYNLDWDCVWETEVDAAGNVYIIGGIMPLQLHKYNAAGTLQWVYNTPYDTTMWLGTFATDDAGNSYVANGSSAKIQKISPAGGVLWDNPSPGGLSGTTEFWSISFNCDQTKLVIGGTAGTVQPYIFDIDMASGNVTASVQVAGGASNEVRSITATPSAKYYFLTHDSLGYIDQGGTVCNSGFSPSFLAEGYNFTYKCENWRQSNTGIEALAFYGGHIYVNRGNQIHKRDFATGAIVSTAPIPGGLFGINVPIFGLQNQLGNSGIDIDNCGNIFVGSQNQVVQFNTNLVQIATFPTAFNVYDVEISTAGNVIAAGSTGDSDAGIVRTGAVQSFAVGACVPQTTTCCNASVCLYDNMLCTSDAPITLTPYEAGGTWAPSPGLNTGTGVFNPATAGAGIHVLYYNLACGLDSATITVADCTPIEICRESNGDLTVTGGAGSPYSWDAGETSPTCITGFDFYCGALTAQGPLALQWTNFGTGTTVTPPVGIDTVQVTDAFGNVLVVNGLGTLPACSATCDATITAAGPFCVNAAAVNLTAAETGGTWTGTGITNASNGTFNPATAGVGSHTITYTLGCGDVDTETIVVNALDNAAFSYASGSYCLTDANPTPTITGLAGGTFTINNSGVINASTGVINIAGSGVGSYTVTYTTTGTCPNSATFNITITSSTDATITQAGPFCQNATAINLSAVSPVGTWTGTGITDGTLGTFNPTTAGVGNHVITYTITGSCGAVDTMTIVVNASSDASFTYPSGSYCLSDPNPTPSITGTVGGTFTINNSGVINASTGVINLSGSGLGSYIVTYSTTGTCPDTNTFNITITNTTDATITQAGPFCQNASAVNLTAVSPGGTWTGTGITDGTLGTFNPTTAGVGSHVITYTISGSCGSVDTMTIVVNATDNPAFSYASNSFCLTDANPTPTITGLAGGTFTINNGGVINAGTGLINITSSGAGSYTVTYTTNGSCPNSQTFNITINSCTSPLPVANFAASQTNVCVGDCISFTDMSSSSASGGITTWAWTFTGATPTSSSSQNPTNICYNTAGTYQVILTVTDANGSDTETKIGYITVTSCTVPTAGFSISDTAICAGSCINFTDASTGATSWQWTFENGNPPSSIVQNPTNICFNDSGTHEVKLVVSNTFGSDSVIQYVAVYWPQQVFIGNDTIIQLGESVGLNATGVTNGVYTWSPPTDLSCTVCPSPIATPEETITYTVITSDTNGCVSSDNITIIVEFENVIFVPNIFSPNGDGVNDMLFVRGKGVAELKFFVYDRWGEKVFETTRLDVGWDGTFRGKEMNKAVFVYYLEATFIDGKQVTQKGDITLIK